MQRSVSWPINSSYFPNPDSYILGNIDMDYLIDVIGILSSVGRERVYERNCVATKFKFIELESNCLGAHYLDRMLMPLTTLYNLAVMNSTKILFNPEILEAEKLKNIICIVLGTNKHVIGGKDWWYTGCVCNKGVASRDDKKIRTRRYLQIKSVTDTGQVVRPTILPTVIGELVEQTMLFKIVVNNDVNFRFEQSFHVKKLCPGQDVVATFKNVIKNFGGVEDDFPAGVVHNDIDAGVVQDLGIKFENIVIKEKYGDNGSTSKHIKENAAESTPVKGA
ncbi:unnamed protein product [Vicia faba]|uniref:Uncharacterized protein n=1 Tax=Vicia faba TaxID=3906 RepID=A0AAV0YSS6_VICFA|nr:unnamed protein product [Vicia faba]